MSYGLYGPAMHDHVLRELEIGPRAARCENDEACGFGPIFDLLVDQHRAAEEETERLHGTTEPCHHEPCHDPWCHTHGNQL